MRRRAVLKAGLGALLLPAAARAHYVDLSAALVRKGRFTVGMALAGRPFSYQEDGALKGLEPALAGAVADAHGLSLDVVRLPRDGLAAALAEGRVDAINTMALAATPADAGMLPYLVLGDHVMVLRGNPFRIDALDDLAGRVVAVPSGSSAESFARDVNSGFLAAGRPAMTIHSFPYQRDVHFPVSMGHAAAYFVQSRTAVAATLDPEGRTRMLPGAFRAQREAGFGLSAGNDMLHHAVEHAIAAMVATGKYDALLQVYSIPDELSAFRRDR